MQEEVNEKIITLSVQGARITASMVKAAMRKFLMELEREGQKSSQIKQAEKQGQARERGIEKEKQRQEKKKPHGKQTIKQLQEQGAQLTNIQITNQNIKSFDRVARKYGIDYSLKRDDSMTPQRYLVFLKAKDVEVMTAAFKEYAGVSIKKSKKQSVLKKLKKSVQKMNVKHRQREKVKQKVRGQQR